jgi:alpha-tubulin suppressor-like RCC1 family protein
MYAGDNHTCALTASGKAYCWGRNDAGQLGTGVAKPVCIDDRRNTSACADDPVGPQPLATEVSFTALALGQFHTCGLDADGRVYCWGEPAQIARTNGNRLAPEPIETELRFNAIAAGARHTCGISRAGEVHCWGENRFGQLGTGTKENALLPTPLADRR